MKRHNELNVFKYKYMPWRYIDSWGYNIQLFFNRFRYAWQRATRGYCDRDIWSLDYYYTFLLADSIEQLAKIGCGFPAELNSSEEWIEILNKISFLLRESNEDLDEWVNPYEDIVLNPNGTDNSDKYIEEVRKWREAENDRFKYRAKCKDDALALIAKWWYNLWD